MIIALIILIIALIGCNEYINRPQHRIYNMYSHLEHGHKKEEEYLLKSNGILKVGNGQMPWISDGQLFNKSHFKICKIGEEFTLRYHTKPYNLYVEHTYKAENYGDYVIIRWLRQKQVSFNYLYNKVEMFNVPDTYLDYSCYPPLWFELTEETGKNLMFFADEIKAGESVTLSFLIDHSK